MDAPSGGKVEDSSVGRAASGKGDEDQVEGTWSDMLKASVGPSRSVARCTLLKWLQTQGSGSKRNAQTKQLVGARDDRAAGEPARACHNAHAQKPENGMDVAQLPD